MPIQPLLDRLDATLAASRRVPMTTRVVVDAEALGAAVEDLRRAIVRQAEDVDEYLRDIAGALEVMRPSEDGAPATPVAEATTARVQPVLEAAEVTARRVREEAESDARRVAAQAERDAQEKRAQVAAEGAEYLRRVREASERIEQLADAAANDMSSLTETVRGRGDSVQEQLATMLEHLNSVSEGYQGEVLVPPQEPDFDGPVEDGDRRFAREHSENPAALQHDTAPHPAPAL